MPKKPPGGLYKHRFKDNPEEKRFAEAWQEQIVQHNNLHYLLDPNASERGYPKNPEPREFVVAATVIQWLGSPVGQHWLQELGYVRVRNFDAADPGERLVVAMTQAKKDGLSLVGLIQAFIAVTDAVYKKNVKVTVK